jgi:hypothetical protein
MSRSHNEELQKKLCMFQHKRRNKKYSPNIRMVAGHKLQDEIGNKTIWQWPQTFNAGKNDVDRRQNRQSTVREGASVVQLDQLKLRPWDI